MKIRRFRSVILAFALMLGFMPVMTASAFSSSNWWPLPASGQKFWWFYNWVNGPQSICTRNNLKIGVAADYLNDGAFNSESLLSLSYFKEDPCTYWAPNWKNSGKPTSDDLILRSYSKGMVSGPSTIRDKVDSSNSTSTFLSFRGHTAWAPDRTGSTQFIKDGQLINSIPERYATYVNNVFTFRGGVKYTYDSGDNTILPNYALMPDRPINADIVISRNPSLRTPGTDQLASSVSNGRVHCMYYATSAPYKDVWDNQVRTNPNNCVTTQPRSAMFMRKTNFVWNETWPDGTTISRSVFYVGYSESGYLNEAVDGASSGHGACEEWWFADGIGPVYIGAYPDASLATCRDNYLAANKVLTNGVSAINAPEAFFSTNQNLIGYMKQTYRCIIATCNITY